MTKLIRLILIAQMALWFSCAGLKYQDDVGLLVSAQADSPEFPVYVNGHLCTDMEGHAGLCSKRLSSTADLVLTFDPQSYGYLATFRAPSKVDPIAPITVEPGAPGKVLIPEAAFAQVREFAIQGYINPQDRPEKTSSMFSVHVIVYDAAYTQREAIQLHEQGGKTYLVLGQFARSAWVYDNGNWAQHSKEPQVEILGDPKAVKAYSESFAARFNFFNMTDADGGVQ